MTSALKPSELLIEQVAFDVDREALTTFREEGGEKKGTKTSTFKSGFLRTIQNGQTKTVLLRLEGELTTPGITASDYGESFGLRLVDQADLTMLQQLLARVMPMDDPEADHWELKPITRGADTIYLKPKTRKSPTGEVYTFTSNVPMRPGDENAAGLDVAQPIRVTAHLSAYYTFTSDEEASPMCGLFFTLKDVHVVQAGEGKDMATQTPVPVPQPTTNRRAGRGRAPSTTR